MLASNISRLLAFIVVAMFLSACAKPSSNTQTLSYSSNSSSQNTDRQEDDLKIVAHLPPPDHTNNGTDILISENDLLEVSVFQVEDLNKEVRVQSNGTISLPLIGSVSAVGKTIPVLEADVERLYGRNYLQSPEVSIFMKESAGQRITLDGEFSKPGIYQGESQTTLLKATALAAGLTPLADEKKLFIYRKIGTQTYVAQHSIKEIRQGNKSDPRIYGGDVIIAFQSGTKVASKNLRETLGMAVSATSLIRPY